MKKANSALLFISLLGVFVFMAAGLFYLSMHVPLYTPEREGTKATSMERSESVRFLTQDGIQIVGDYYAATGTSGIVLLHMMPADRTSWRALATKLQNAGFSVLAIDLRGHGQSAGGPHGYQTFSYSEHQQSLLDVAGAVELLHAKGVKKIHIGGASIGANLAVQYAAKHPEIASMILLSPGLDYHGIHADIWIDSLKQNQAVLLAASDDDAYSFTSVKDLFDRSSNLPAREIKLLTRAGHGTHMLEAYPAFADELVAWLKKIDAK